MEQERRHSHQTEVQPREARRQRTGIRGRRDPNAEEEDDFVEHLREQNVAWRAVAERFRMQFGKDTSEARLQMRLQRRRKGRAAAMWDEDDVSTCVAATLLTREKADKMFRLDSIA